MTAKEQSFSARRVIWLALARPKNLDKEQLQELSRACLLHPEVATGGLSVIERLWKRP